MQMYLEELWIIFFYVLRKLKFPALICKENNDLTFLRTPNSMNCAVGTDTPTSEVQYLLEDVQSLFKITQ